MAGFDVDPATMKGTADLKVKIALPVKNIPDFVDLPISVSGTVSDLGIDKVFGKDRLEGAKLAIGYENGDLTIKGDGKIAGGAASIDLQKSPSGGEANVTFSLDEATRAKRGMSFGSQLTGTFPLKVVVALGKDAKPGMRIDADLTKAGIDQLIPGWVKPVGRAAKLSFTMMDGATTEIRDLQLDSGPTQLRGSATLAADGALDKAGSGDLQALAGRRHARPGRSLGRRVQGVDPGQCRRCEALRESGRRRADLGPLALPPATARISISILTSIF